LKLIVWTNGEQQAKHLVRRPATMISFLDMMRAS